MKSCDIVGKTVLCKWETLATTELYFEDRKVFHKSVEETLHGSVEHWIEANVIVMVAATNLFCVNWEDDAGNSFTLFLDTLSMEAKATLSYEDGGVNSKPQHIAGNFKFID